MSIYALFSNFYIFSFNYISVILPSLKSFSCYGIKDKYILLEFKDTKGAPKVEECK
jgi:hypothetical protein